MYKTNRCSKCGNNRWKQISKDNFLCLKCRQMQQKKEKEKIQKDTKRPIAGI